MEVNEKKIVVGICAMAKKTQSKPMQEILTRLEMFEYISVNVFEERDVIEKPVVEWPHCDCLISFQSSDILAGYGPEVTGVKYHCTIADVSALLNIGRFYLTQKQNLMLYGIFLACSTI
ncbi:unnamed protein product [Clavelina lepadiformis]|uniref:VIP1 N-terminal domain-containing protein n=1 Tax=Clavelina lepadiformis TaxID=159417 RepID=A0ABP0GTV3_CLALP